VKEKREERGEERREEQNHRAASCQVQTNNYNPKGVQLGVL